MTSAVYHDNNNESANPAFTWLYSVNGTPRVHKDGYAGLKYNYSYDAIGRLIRTDISNTSGAAVGSTEYGYNTRGHLVSITNDIGGNAYGQYYSYSDTGVSGALANAKDGLPTRYRTLGVNTDYEYDDINRLTLRSVKVSDTLNLNNSYTYKNSALRGTGYTTTQLASESVVGVNYGYTYDNMGNITGVTRSGSAYKTYTYDSLGELLSETQHSLNKKDSYSYDPLGNIRSKTTTNATTGANISTVTYNYGQDSTAGWNYLLTSITTEDYNGNKTTETIDYDQIGNPLSYRGATMSWFGRQLRTYSKGSTSANFVYDADGLRSAKAVNGTTTTYQYVGDQLFYENRGNGNELYYFYDNYGNLSRIYHHNNGARVAYFVATNAQGDVIALYNSNGVKVGAYDYDAWGNQRVFVVTQNADGANVHTQINPETQYLTHIVNLNPIRYRGYFYDRDLGLYYLQSRYYDASIGRFINADGYISTGQGVLGYSMFAYCGNNPVINSDFSGEYYYSASYRDTESANSIFGLFISAVVAWVVCRMYPTATRALPRYSTQRYSSRSISDSKAEEKSEAIPKAPPASDSTVIYRHGGTNPGNLTPSQRDVDLYPITGKGLSFSTVPKPGAAMTTIEALNSTGVVYAVYDGDNHVSVHPIGGTLADWHNAGSSSVWTTAVKSVVVKWDGGN